MLRVAQRPHENSPAFQRRVLAGGNASPVGTAEWSAPQPSLSGLFPCVRVIPALKRRAIVGCPCGTNAGGTWGVGRNGRAGPPNRNAVAASSPRLARERLPWVRHRNHDLPQRGCIPGGRGCNSFRVNDHSRGCPRVVRWCGQPGLEDGIPSGFGLDRLSMTNGGSWLAKAAVLKYASTNQHNSRNQSRNPSWRSS